MGFSVSPNRCFVNAPFLKLKEGLIDLFVENNLQPEIGLEGNLLYDTPHSEFQSIADILRKNNLNCTLHAPFFDLAPGALDKAILAATRDKLNRAFDLISLFKPQAVICHLNFEENKHGYKLKEWFPIAHETWSILLEKAASGNTILTLENTYEKTPTQHQKILEALDSDHAGFCLDVGHLMSFANSRWQEWLPAMSPWLKHLHLHDNDGSMDSHLAIGRGNFDFSELFRFLARNNLSPLVTLEPHSEDDLWANLHILKEMNIVSLGKNN